MDEPLNQAVALTRKRGRPAADLPELAFVCKVCHAAISTAQSRTGLCAKHNGASLTVEEERKLAREHLERHAAYAAQLQVQGAEIAARKGDTRPAEWLLLHTRTIEPVRTVSEGHGGVVVNIGMVLPGCGQ